MEEVGRKVKEKEAKEKANKFTGLDKRERM